MSMEELSWLRENVLMGFQAPEHGRRPAWHYLEDDPASRDNHFEHAVPVEAVLDRLFNWTAVECPLVARVRVGGSDKSPKFEDVVDPSRKAIVRSDDHTIVGVHHKTYEMHQFPRWLIDVVAEILGDELQIGSAGQLRGGALAWVSVEVPQTIKTKEGVDFYPRLLATTAHDGTTASRYNGHNIIVECDNTLAMGLTEGSVFRVRHTRHSEAKIADAHEALGFVHTMADDFAKEVAGLCKQRVSDQQFERFMDRIVPLPEREGRSMTIAQTKHEILSRLWREDERVAPWRNTAWGALMAANTAGQWEYGVRGFRSERNLTRTAYDQWRRDDVAALDALEAVLA